MNNIKKYQVITAFCFQKDTVHIQVVNLDTAVEALAHLETDNTRSEQWKAEGSTIYSVQINEVKVYGHGGVGIYFLDEKELRLHAQREQEKKGEVS